MQSLVYGVGINDCYGWASSWRTAGKEDLKFRIYHLWHRMLQRVYSARFHIKNPFYIGCSVCERWHRLSLFAEDIKKLPNFELWAASPNGRVMLDKDTLVVGNKEYSPTTCCFLTAEESSHDVGIRHREEVRALGKNPLIIAKRAAKKRKAVLCVRPNGEQVLYNSGREAAERESVDYSNISKCCRGIYKTCGNGRIFRFA